MKEAKNWKIVNYIDTDVLFHEENPKCIVARTLSTVRSSIPSIETQDANFYILHWLESTNISNEQSKNIINSAVDAWNIAKIDKAA